MEITEQYQGMDAERSWFQPWLVSFAASLLFFYEFIQGNMFASIADNIMQEFAIQVDKMTYLSSTYYLSNVLFLFWGGVLLDRFNAKKTLMCAMVMCIASTFVLANTNSFYVALVCRFITGIGSAFCLGGPIRVASRWFPARKMAMVTGCIVTLAMMGGMIAQYPLTKLVNYLGWREALLVVGWFGCALLLIMAAWIKEAPEQIESKHVAKPSLLATAKQAYCNAQAVCAAIYTSLMNMGIAVLGAMIGTLYIMQRLGVSKEDAAMVNSLLFLGTIIGGPTIGWISDKLGIRVWPMKIGAIASLATILAIIYLPVSLIEMKVLFLLLGFFTSAQILSYAIVAESSPAVITATAVSLVSIATQVGYVIYQNLFSWLLLKFGTVEIMQGVPVYSLAGYQTAILIIPLGILLALLLIFNLRETHCKRVV